MKSEAEKKNRPEKLYGAQDELRFGPVVKLDGDEDYRSPWRRDFARLVHSPAFRRLQGKTQLFPNGNSDFFRNRLTHSLEVAQIAKSIALKLNYDNKIFRSKKMKIDLDLVEFSALAHDLGHPPFGHNGESALDELMRESGGFEGNAQTFHILACIERKERLYDENSPAAPLLTPKLDRRLGLNPTYRSLASILKYDTCIPLTRRESDSNDIVKGYYHRYQEHVSKIKESVTGDASAKDFKTIECSIMDVADDIAYSTYDLEDCFKSKHLHPAKMIILSEQIYKFAADTINNRIKKYYPDKDYKRYKVEPSQMGAALTNIFKDLFDVVGEADIVSQSRELDIELLAAIATRSLKMSYKAADEGYTRTHITSRLIQRFLSGIEIIEHEKYPQLHNVRLDIDTFITVETLKNVVFNYVIMSPELQTFEARGKDIVKTIFSALRDDKTNRMLPLDYRDLCASVNPIQRDRLICDFVAGMTDRYAWEFYGRLRGASSPSMFIPI